LVAKILTKKSKKDFTLLENKIKKNKQKTLVFLDEFLKQTNQNM